jgi:chorismate mutase
MSESSAAETGLAPFRARLDVIDDELVRLLGERFQICREVAVHKSRHEIPMMQPGRVEVVRARYLDGAAAVDLPREFTGEFFDLMIAATCRAEDELMDELAARREGRAEDRPSGDAPARRDQVA